MKNGTMRWDNAPGAANARRSTGDVETVSRFRRLSGTSLWWISLAADMKTAAVAPVLRKPAFGVTVRNR